MRDKIEFDMNEESIAGRLSNIMEEKIKNTNSWDELVESIWNDSDLADEEVVILLISLGMIINEEYGRLI